MSMATVAKQDPWRTHTVANQPPPLEGRGRVLQQPAAGRGDAARGRRLGRASAPRDWASWWAASRSAWGTQANENKPVLKTHDRYGNRIDEVEFHPAWHKLMKMGVEHELHSLPWTSSEPAPTRARAALYMTAMQAEAGFACPITMTFAVVPALRAQPELAAEWEPLVTATHYDPRLVRGEREGQRDRGMAMTEKQGGSDVRANTTLARPLNGGGAGRGVRDHRPQVVLLGADVRPVPGARASGPTRASPAFCCRASCPTAAATPFTCSA